MHGPRRSSRCGRRAGVRNTNATGFSGDRSPFVSARDGDTYWFDQGDGVKVTDGSKMRTSLSSAWVVSRRWTIGAMERELLDASISVLGRSCARIRVTPEPESKWRLRHVFIGDVHEITVDLATGLTLAATGMIDGAAFHDDEVTDLEVDAPVADALTEVPPDAETVPVSQGSRTLEEIAAAAGLTVLAPTWLPAEYSFQSGGVYVRDDVPQVSLTFSRDRREFDQLFEWPESQPRGEGDYVWERVERGSRTVLISDLSDRVGERVVQVTLEDTWVNIIATAFRTRTPRRLAFSLERVIP